MASALPGEQGSGSGSGAALALLALAGGAGLVLFLRAQSAPAVPPVTTTDPPPSAGLPTPAPPVMQAASGGNVLIQIRPAQGGPLPARAMGVPITITDAASGIVVATALTDSFGNVHYLSIPLGNNQPTAYVATPSPAGGPYLNSSGGHYPFTAYPQNISAQTTVTILI